MWRVIAEYVHPMMFLVQRKHILMTRQEWEAEEPMSVQSKLVLSIE